jgi:hypothetical protein
MGDDRRVHPGHRDRHFSCDGFIFWIVVMSYITKIESTVAGIPCLIGVTYFDCVQGSYSYNAPSDVDYYGYRDAEWEVLDRRGRPAAWLERKLTDDDCERIELKIATVMDES